MSRSTNANGFLVIGLMFISYTVSVPFQSNQSKAEEAQKESVLPLEDPDDNQTTEPTNYNQSPISFCSPACAEATINPCNSYGECDDGQECCLDMCLSSTVCRPLSPAKELSSISQIVPEEERDLFSPISTEENSELVKEKSTSEVSGTKRNAQYDALTYALTLDEYHSNNPLQREADVFDDEVFEDSDAVTTEIPQTSDSDLFRSPRESRSPQDETGGFPYVPVKTYDISDSRPQNLERFNEGNLAQTSNKELESNETIDDNEQDRSIHEAIEITSDFSDSDDLERIFLSLDEKYDESRKKRSQQLNSDNIADDSYNLNEPKKEPQSPPTFVFVKRVPGLSLKELVESGQATITKIVAPFPANDDLNGSVDQETFNKTMDGDSITDFDEEIETPKIQAEGEE